MLAGVTVLAVPTPGGVSSSVTSSLASRVVPSASTRKALRTTPSSAALNAVDPVTQASAPEGTRRALRSCHCSQSERAVALDATPLPGSGRPGSLLAARAASFGSTVMRTPVALRRVSRAAPLGVYPTKPVPFIQPPPGAGTVVQLPPT